MTDYFKLYKTVVLAIRERKPSDGQELLDALTNYEYIKEELAANNKELVNDTFTVLENLFDDGLVKGKCIVTKSGNLYMIHDLTTLGFQYLQIVAEPTMESKFKAYLKENGVPFTPKEITKFLSHMFFE
jgi:hypothetical protein